MALKALTPLGINNRNQMGLTGPQSGPAMILGLQEANDTVNNDENGMPYPDVPKGSLVNPIGNALNEMFGRPINPNYLRGPQKFIGQAISDLGAPKFGAAYMQNPAQAITDYLGNTLGISNAGVFASPEALGEAGATLLGLGGGAGAGAGAAMGAGAGAGATGATGLASAAGGAKSAGLIGKILSFL